MSDVEYKGFVIRVAPYQTQTGEFTHDYYLIKHREDATIETAFGSNSLFNTMDQAVAACHADGRRRIDEGFAV